MEEVYDEQSFDKQPSVDDRGLVIRSRPAPLPEGPTTTSEALSAGLNHYPDRQALVHGPTSFTYAELDARVDAIAGGLTAAGLKPGNVLACSLPNCTALVEAFLATQRLGVVWLGINTNLMADEVDWVQNDANVDLLLTTTNQTKMAGDRPTLTVNPIDGSGSWTNLITAGHPAPSRSIDPQDPAAIAYTSGTTGRPKGVVHSQHNLLWPGISSRHSYPPIPNEQHGTALALTILNMMVLGPLWAYLRGTTAVLLEHTDAVGFAEEVRLHGINRVTLVPTMAHDLVTHTEVDLCDLVTLTQTIIGAGHSPPALRNDWEAKFGTRPLVGYGLTEAPSGVTREHVDRPARPDGAGYPLEPLRVVVVDDNDHPLPDGDTGEICLAPVKDGPWANVWTPMLGYLNQPQATAESLRGGVLHTGDLGFLDEHGQLVIRGRRTEMILRGGANVYPAEVARVILDHPGVSEVAVLGLPDERLGEVVVAGLVAESGDWADGDPAALLEDVQSYCLNHLAHYKVPAKMLVLHAIPRNAMGKVVEAELRPIFNQTWPT